MTNSIKGTQTEKNRHWIILISLMWQNRKVSR